MVQHCHFWGYARLRFVEQLLQAGPRTRFGSCLEVLPDLMERVVRELMLNLYSLFDIRSNSVSLYQEGHEGCYIYLLGLGS